MMRTALQLRRRKFLLLPDKEHFQEDIRQRYVPGPCSHYNYSTIMFIVHFQCLLRFSQNVATVSVDRKISGVVMAGAHMTSPSARGMGFPLFFYLLSGFVPILLKQW